MTPTKLTILSLEAMLTPDDLALLIARNPPKISVVTSMYDRFDLEKIPPFITTILGEPNMRELAKHVLAYMHQHVLLMSTNNDRMRFYATYLRNNIKSPSHDDIVEFFHMTSYALPGPNVAIDEVARENLITTIVANNMIRITPANILSTLNALAM